jgi:hypothetical protein
MEEDQREGAKDAKVREEFWGWESIHRGSELLAVRHVRKQSEVQQYS